MEIKKRFFSYLTIDTQSNEQTEEAPSSNGQWRLAKMLFEELRQLGAQEVSLDEYGYVFATIPATTAADVPVLGFLAHMDTSPSVSGRDIEPRIVSSYAGQDIPLDDAGHIVLSPQEYPSLLAYQGQDIIVTDGSTLLGADDKAGIAEIMSMTEYLLTHPEIPHGKIRIGFTIDEEIGRGTEHFDVQAFGAQLAYTVDGGQEGEIQYENFNAATAQVCIKGVNIHPGSAKDKMKNAVLIAMEFAQLLPKEEIPAKTQDYEGFFHLDQIKGDVEQTEMTYLLRDHHKENFVRRKQQMEAAAEQMNQIYGAGTVQVNSKDSYYNMQEKIAPYPELIEHAKAAWTAAGVTPVITPIRGGTDGAMLSYMGLPCPNLGTGGHNFHSRYEYISLQAMEKTTQMLIHLAQAFVPQD